MKKRIIMCFVCFLLASTSLAVYANDETGHTRDYNPVFVRTINAKDGGTHTYPIYSNNGDIIGYGTCHDVIYTDEYTEHCVNCTMPMHTTTKTRLEHNRQ